MNYRPKADVIKWLRGGDRAHNRRGLGYLLGCYGSSVVTGVICGFLLGNGWGHQPVTLAYNVRLPGTSTAVALTPPQISVLDTISTAKISTAQDPDTVDKKPVTADKKPVAAASQSSSPPPHTLPPVAKSRTMPSPPPAFSEPERPQAVQPVPKPAKTLPPLTAPKSQSPSSTEEPITADKEPATVDKEPTTANKEPGAADSQSSSPPPHTLPPVAKSRTMPSPPPAFSEPEKPQAVQPAPKPAKTLPPLTAPKSQSPSSTAYIVQVGAFGQAANAAQVVSQLKKDGYEAGLLKINKSDGNVLYRVYIARFSDESRAKAAAEVFRENQKRDAYAVRYEPALSATRSEQQ